MPSILSPRAALVLALATGVWVGTLLALDMPELWWQAVMAGLWFGGTTWLATRWPWLGLAATIAGLTGLSLMDVSDENAAPIGPLWAVLVLIGYLRPARIGVLAPALLLTVLSTLWAWDPASIAIGVGLILIPWWFGVLVQRRDERRTAAVAVVQELSIQDPEEHAQQAAVVEHERIASSAFTVISDAVASMARAARETQPTLDPAGVESIRSIGRSATAQLRELLLLLRQEHGSDERVTAIEVADSTTDSDQAPATRRVWWRSWLGLGWPGALTFVVALVTHLTVGEAHAGALIVAAALAIALGFRRRFTFATILASAVLIAAAGALGMLDSNLDSGWIAIPGIVLSWTAGRVGGRVITIAWLVLVGGVIIQTIDEPGNIPFMLANLIVPFAAGAAWSGKHAAEREQRDRANALGQELDRVERMAAYDRRIRLARDLHDIASHAVGTMMMQANAARVLRTSDPEGARLALQAIIDIGEETVQELHSTALAIEEPPLLGAPSDAGGDRHEVRESLEDLVRAAERDGLKVSVAFPASEISEEDAQLLLRVVRVGLSNAVRHAPNSDVAVSVADGADGLSVRIVNGPPSEHVEPGHVASRGSGLGLRGLRELVEARGGTLRAAATSTGYELCATVSPADHAAPECSPPMESSS